MTKKMILGIAAGVAALAVVGVICKRKGYLDTWCDKADELSDDLKDKYQSVKESARKRFDEVVQKGGEIADKIKTHAAESGPADPATT
jgi:ABC-type transporter MlaC component